MYKFNISLSVLRKKISRRPLSSPGVARPLSETAQLSVFSSLKIARPKKKNKQEVKKKPLDVRKEFPETWLWTEEIIKFFT